MRWFMDFNHLARLFHFWSTKGNPKFGSSYFGTEISPHEFGFGELDFVV